MRPTLPDCADCGRSPWVHELRSRNGIPILQCRKAGKAFPDWVTYDVLLTIGAKIPNGWRQKPPDKHTSLRGAR